MYNHSVTSVLSIVKRILYQLFYFYFALFYWGGIYDGFLSRGPFLGLSGPYWCSLPKFLGTICQFFDMCQQYGILLCSVKRLKEFEDL